MRADRLISILMLLQSRGQMTARELAGELEVSERTIYRDVEALCMAGVPLYCERGPGGGIALLDDYRTTLTGLTADESRALFMLSIPAPLFDLGMASDMQSALLKLAAALPETFRPDETRTRQRIYIDSVWWHAERDALPELSRLQQAVWQDLMLEVEYHWMNFLAIPRRLAPYGLVAKGGVWYLVWESEGRFGAYRVSELRSIQVLEERFERRIDFDLKRFWDGYCEYELSSRPVYPVKLRIAPELESRWLPGAGRLVEIKEPEDEPDKPGWRIAILTYESLHEARQHLLALGGVVEVLEPQALRLSLIDYARQILKNYPPKMGRD